jgi:CHAD domain-containing protein
MSDKRGTADGWDTAADPDTPDERPGAAGPVLAYARAQVHAIHELAGPVRANRPDSVHRMRVATRRLRGCFRSYRAVLDRDRTRALGGELGRLAAELGADRDREVLAARFATRLGELPPELILGPVPTRLRARTGAGTGSFGDDTRGRLPTVLDGERHRALLGALDALLADPPLRAGAGRDPADRVLAAAVARDRERCTKRLSRALAVPPGPARDEALHEARKAAKRARYAAEAARPVLGGEARGDVARFTGLQDLLGEHQDSVLARRVLLEPAEAAQRAGAPSFTYGLLYGRETALAGECERALAGGRH